MKIPAYMLPHRATITKFIGNSAYGPQWAGTTSNVPCRIDPSSKRVKGANGDDVTSRAEALFHPDYSIATGDKVEWNGTTYTVESADPIDMMGLHHYEVVLS